MATSPTNPYAGQPATALGPTGQPTVDFNNPATGSPLGALQQYLDGIQYSGGTDSSNAAAGTGIQNVLGGGGVTGIDAMLKIAQQYDPNASITKYDNSNEGDDPMEKISMDYSKLPKIPAGFTAINGVTDNSDAGGVQGGVHLYNNSQVYKDPNWGYVTPTGDINKNYDTHGGGFFKSNIGNWAPMLTLGMAGIGGLGFLGNAAGTAGAASGLGTAGNAAMGLLSRDPTSLLNGNVSSLIPGLISGAAGLSGIPGASTAASLAYGASKGQQLTGNTALNAAPALIKYLQSLGGGSSG